MNSFTNVVLLICTFPILGICLFIGLDLPIEFLKTTGAQLPYQSIIFGICSFFIFWFTFRRSLKRWMGIKLINQTQKFLWNRPVTRDSKTIVVTYNLLEALIMGTLAFGIHEITDKAWLISMAYGVAALDNVLFTVLGLAKNLWRVGITKKAVLLSDREVTVMYFQGLRKVSFSQETLYFDYIKDLHLHMPVTPVEDKEAFISCLKDCVNSDKTYWDPSILKLLK